MPVLAFLIASTLIAQEAKVTPLMSKDLAEFPGKEGVMITVVYPPGATDPIHRHNAYAFEVHSLATKTDIRKAVEALWNVRVVAIRTQNRVGKPRRSKAVVVNLQPWKKAIVKLHEDDRIAFF